jgi:hypothetical protein
MKMESLLFLFPGDLVRRGRNGSVHGGSSLIYLHVPCHRKRKKPTWQNTLKVFDHVGLIVNEPSSYAGVLFI